MSPVYTKGDSGGFKTEKKNKILPCPPFSKEGINYER
jgi:hypothetical protein